MWKESYKIGVDLIDEQHEELFSRLEKFIIMVRDDAPYDEKLDKLDETFKFLDEYLVYHFREEEDFQKRIDYPYIDEHLEEHKLLNGVMEVYKRELKEGKMTDKRMCDVSARFMTWLIYHVGVTDRKIGDYVESKGIEQ